MAKRGPNEMSDIKEGADPYAILKDAYQYGRSFPCGDGPNPYDCAPPERAPHRMSRGPDMHEYAATFNDIKDTPVSKSVDESAPQFRDEKPAHLNDCANTWVRGMSNQSPHPAFDSGPSGFRYDTKIRR